MANEINDIIIALKAQGFDDFARKAKLPVQSINSLANAMLQSGTRSASALEKFRKTQESIGNLTRAQSLQLQQAIAAYRKYLSVLSESPKKRAKFGDDLSTVIKQTKTAIATRKAQAEAEKKASDDERASILAAAEAKKLKKEEDKKAAAAAKISAAEAKKAQAVVPVTLVPDAKQTPADLSKIVQNVTKASNIKSPLPLGDNLFANNKELLKGVQFDKERLAISTAILSKLNEQLAKENLVNTSILSRERILANIQNISKQTQAFVGDVGKNANINPKELEAFQAQIVQITNREKEFVAEHERLIATINNKAVNKAFAQATPNLLSDIKNKNVTQILPSALQIPQELQGPELVEARAKAVTSLVSKINDQVSKENLANKSLSEQVALANKLQQTITLVNSTVGDKEQVKLITPATLANLDSAKAKLNQIHGQVATIIADSQKALTSKQFTDSFTQTTNDLLKNLKNKNVTESAIGGFASSQLNQISDKFSGNQFDTQRVQLAADLLARANQTFEVEFKKSKTIEQQNNLIAKQVALLNKINSFATKGTLDTQGLKSDPRSLQTLQQQISLSQQQIASSRALTAQQEQQKKQEEELTGADVNYQRSIGVAIGKIIRYRAAFFTMRAAIEGTTTAVRTFTEIQSQLAELSKVIAPTESLVKFRDAAFQMSQQFGTSVNDVVKSYKVWAQAGLKQNEVLKATQATLIGVNAIGLDSLQVTEALTAAIFTYGTAVEDSVKVLSKWLAVERQFPVSAADLANSVKIVGSAGETLGVTLDSLAGFISAINAATRKSGIAVGQSIKTIFAEIPTQDSIASLESVGIAVFKTVNEFRDLDDIFDDLAAKWDTLTSVQKTNIAITLAGVRRFSDFISLMDNYSIKLQATAIAQKASNEALQAANLQLQTLDKTWQKSKAAIDEFAFAVGQTLEGGLATLAETLKSLISSFGNVGDVLPKITASLIAFTVAAVAIGAPLLAGGYLVGTLRRKLKEAKIEADNASKSILGFGAATAAANTSVKVFSIANLTKAFGAFNLVVAAASALAGIFSIIFALTKKPVYETAIALDDFSDSAKNAVTALNDTVNSIQTQQKLVSQLPGVLDSAVEGYKNAEVGSEGYRASIHRLINAISSVSSENEDFKKSQKEVNDVLNSIVFSAEQSKDSINDLSKTQKDSKTSVDTLTTATNSYKQSLQKLSEELDANLIKTKGLRDAQIALSKETIKRRIQDLESQKSSIELALTFNDKDLKTVSDKLDKTLGDRTVEIRTRLQTLIAPDFAKSIRITQEALKKIGAIKELNIPATIFLKKEEAKSQIVSLLGTMQKDIETLAPEIKDALSVVLANPELAASFGLDEQTVAQTVSSVESISVSIQHVFDKLDKIDFTKLTDEESASKLSGLLSPVLQLLNQLDVAQKKIDFKFLADQRVQVFDKEIKKLLEDATDLDKVAGSQAEFVLGVAISREAIEARKKVKDLLESIEDIGPDLLLLKQTAKFGDITPGIDENKFAKIQEFIKSTATQIKDLDKGIKTFTERADELDRFIVEAGKMSEAERNTAAGAEKLRIALSEMVGPETQNDLKGSTKLTEDADKKLKEFRKNAEIFKESKLQLLNSKELVESFGTLKSINSQLARNLTLSQLIQLEYEKLNQDILVQQKLLSQIPGSEEKVQALELKRIELIKRQNLLIAEQADTAEEKVSKAIQAQNQAWQDTQQVLEKIRDIKLDRIFSKIAENANLVQDALSSAFGNIPTNILAGHQKRKELSAQIHDLELEIQEAQREGDHDAANQARQRLDLAKKEMATYRRGWFEIRNIVIDIFDAISQSFWSGLSKRFGELVSKISLGEDTLGNQVAKAMAVATGNLVSSWENTVSNVNNTFLKDYAKLMQDFLKAEADLKKSQTITLPEIQATPSAELEKWPTIALKNIAERLTLAKNELIKSATGGKGADFIGPLTDNPALEDISKEIQRLSDITDKQAIDIIKADASNNSSLRAAISGFSKDQVDVFLKAQRIVATAISLSNKIDSKNQAKLIAAVYKLKPSDKNQQILNSILKKLDVEPQKVDVVFDSKGAQDSEASINNLEKTTQEVVSANEAIAFTQKDALEILTKLQKKEIIIPPVDLSKLSENELELLKELSDSTDLQADIQSSVVAGTTELSGALNAILDVLSKLVKADSKDAVVNKNILSSNKKLNKQTDIITSNDKKSAIKPISIDEGPHPVNTPEDFLKKLVDLQSKESLPALNLKPIEILPDIVSVGNTTLSSIEQLIAEGNADQKDGLGEQSTVLQLIKTGLLTLGASLATSITGTKNKGAQVGAGFGSAVGSALFQTTGAQKDEKGQDIVDSLGNKVIGSTGINKAIEKALGKTLGGVVAGPLGALAGGLVGGLFGGLFGGNDDTEKKLPRAIEDNTQAVNNNTLALKQLDKVIFNAPTGFNVPAFGGGAGFGRSVTININGGDSTEIANKVRKMINNDFRVESNSYGTRGYSR